MTCLPRIFCETVVFIPQFELNKSALGAQTLAWLALDNPSRGRDRARAAARRAFTGPDAPGGGDGAAALAALLDAADAAYAAGPDPKAAAAAAVRGTTAAALADQLAGLLRETAADPALARRRARYNLKVRISYDEPWFCPLPGVRLGSMSLYKPVALRTHL
jgi:hypothetical protein